MIYLDNSATTKPDLAVVNKISEMLTEKFGNPSSFHKAGLEANAEIRAARRQLAAALSCEEEEIYFTSGGTEANNLAVFGAAEANRRRGKRIITTEIEHESVLEAMTVLEGQGFEVIRLAPDSDGNVPLTRIAEAINSDTILISMMYVNNEVGSVLPVASLRKAAKRAGATPLIHIDCVQAFGKMPVKPRKLEADLLTVTAHKIHGPKGIGALYVRKGVRIVPRQYGGAQEKKLRPGTEAAPLIAGFGKAVELFPENKKQAEQLRALNEYTKSRLAAIEGVRFNSPDNASDFIINLFVPSFMTSQTLVQHLSSQYGICVSSGSACAKGKKSHVLTAMRLPDRVIDHSLRISFSRESTTADADALCTAIKEITEKYPL